MDFTHKQFGTFRTQLNCNKLIPLQLQICARASLQWPTGFYQQCKTISRSVNQPAQQPRVSEMILSNSYQVKLPKKYRKVLYLHAAVNDSFVFLAVITDRREGVVHVDKQGKILFQTTFEYPMDSMGLLNDRQAIFIQTRKHRISVLDLETHQFAYFPYHFMNEQSDQADILTFSQSKYLCVEEKGRYNDNRYKLTYFQYPLQLNEKKATRVLAVYEAKETEWTYQHMTRKADNYSMMMWCKPKHDDAFEFKTYDIQKGKGQLRVYKFNQAISAEPNLTKIETVIANCWQIRPNNFIFVCLTNKAQSKKTGGTVVNNNYIIDISNNGAIREANFTFGPYQDLLIDFYNLGPNSMFRTFKMEEAKALKTPTYYIDHESETIMAEETWEMSHLYKYEFEGYASGLICEGLYQNLDVDNFKVNLKRIVYPKDIYLFLLTESGANFEEDLIRDLLHVLS